MVENNIKDLWEKMPYIMAKLPSPGLLLVTGDDKDKQNIMTIGWLQFGIIWGEVTVSIFVRPSRYTHQLINKYNHFTINVMPNKFKKEIAFCGVNSGAFCDKFKELNLQTSKSKSIPTLSLKEAEMVIECKTLHKTNMNEQKLNDLILARYYSEKDFHQIITGAILNINYINKE